MAGRNKTATITRIPTVMAQAMPIPSSSLVAAGGVMGGKRTQSVFRPTAAWQTEAWRQFEICSELAFAANWIANAMSRCCIVPGMVNDKGIIERTDNGEVALALQQMFGGEQAQAEMLHAAGLHLTIAGEFYLVGQERGDGSLAWELIGCDQVTSDGSGGWTIVYGDGIYPVTLAPGQGSVIRVWRPRPDRRYEAWSPVRALLPVLKELEFLTRHIFAQTTSRLAGAGILPLPQSVEFPETQGDGNGNRAKKFRDMLGRAMMESVDDPSSPESLVPIVITVPDASMQYLREPLHFWSPFDAAAAAARKEAILRFCIGMDIPPEIILGMTSGASSSGGRGTGASHWSSWQIEEAAIKLHIEPLLALFCNYLTIDYLRPGLETVPKAAAMYDTTALKLQPDRSKEALELADRGKISDEALLLYSGMQAGDAATPDEQDLFLLRRVAGASATPDQVAWAMDKLGVSGMPTGDSEALPPGSNQPPAPSLLEHPAGQGTPDDYSAKILCALSEPLVLRALERVGSKMRQAGIRPVCSPYETHVHALVNGSSQKYLEGAWTMVPTVAEGIADPALLTRVLNSYVENLLTQQIPHSRDKLEKYLLLVQS